MNLKAKIVFGAPVTAALLSLVSGRGVDTPPTDVSQWEVYPRMSATDFVWARHWEWRGPSGLRAVGCSLWVVAYGAYPMGCSLWAVASGLHRNGFGKILGCGLGCGRMAYEL